LILLYNVNVLFVDIVQFTQNSAIIWGFVVSIKFWKPVVFAVDDFTQSNGVV
jgi:hypothetical protein